MKLFKILSPVSKVPKENSLCDCETVPVCVERLNSALGPRKEEDLMRICQGKC